jgi:hypothetical protein
MKFDDPSDLSAEEDEDSDLELPADNYNRPDEDDEELEEPNDDDINEDNYRTTFDIEEDPEEDAETLSDYIADE